MNKSIMKELKELKEILKEDNLKNNLQILPKKNIKSENVKNE